MRAALAGMACLPLLLTGCALVQGSDPTAEPGVAIQGSLYGGQQPIVGARIYLLAANTTGYGGAGIAAASSNASLSLLNASATGASDSIGAYVTSGASGTFSISGDYSCTPGMQVYLYAKGGNPGAGTNSLAGLMAVLGDCPGTGNFASATPHLIVNEATTIAAAYAMAAFASDATHVSSSGTTAAKLGIKNAFANAANLVDVSNGVTRSTTPSGNGTVPQQLINTLGNILAACINTSGSVSASPTPTACYTLLQNAQSNGTSGTLPSDTATAAINIAHHPGTAIASLFGLPTAQAPFAPQLSSAPNDFTIGVEYKGAGVDDPIAVAIDAGGYIWVANHGGAGTVSELSPIGAAVSPVGGYLGTAVSGFFSIAIDPSGDAWLPAYYDGSIIKISGSGIILSGSGGYTGGSIRTPLNVAVDGSGNVWETDCGNQFCTGPYTLAELSGAGSVLSGATGYTGPVAPASSIAFDSAGNAWVANKSNKPTISDSIAKFSSAGTLLSGAGYTGGGLNTPYALAIDHSGNVWVASYGTSSSNVSKFSSSGAPLSPSTGYTATGINSAVAIAVDGDGQVWVANTGQKTLAGQSNLVELSNSGVLLSPDAGYQGGNIDHPLGVAIDGSGNVWTINAFNSSVTELVGAGAPTVTPLSVAVRDNTLGVRP